MVDHNMLMLFLLVCGGALIWGVVNVIKSHLLRGKGVHEDVAVVATMAGASVSAFAVEFAINGVPAVSVGFWWPFVATALLNVFIQYFNVRSLKIEEASIVVPLAATMPVFVIFMSWLILGELPTFYGKIGIVVVAIGSYVLMLKGSSVPLPRPLSYILPAGLHEPVRFYGAPWFRIISSRGAQLALMTSYLGAVSSNFDKLATLHSSPMLFTGSAFAVVALFVYLWSKNKKGPECWDNIKKDYFWTLFGIGVVVGLYGSVLNAGYLYGIVPYVGTLKRTQILWTVILAGMFLREKYTGIRIVGATIIFGGSVLIAF